MDWQLRMSKNSGDSTQHKLDDVFRMLPDFLTWYFRPKPFESLRRGTIYDRIGIRWYKTYLPTTGDRISRRRKIIQLHLDKNRPDELLRLERKTRNYEWRHLLGILGFVVLAVCLDKQLTLFDWIFLSLLNLYVNIYPIFLQRYNRIRIVNLLRRHGLPDPYA